MLRGLRRLLIGFIVLFVFLGVIAPLSVGVYLRFAHNRLATVATERSEKLIKMLNENLEKSPVNQLKIAQSYTSSDFKQGLFDSTWKAGVSYALNWKEKDQGVLTYSVNIRAKHGPMWWVGLFRGDVLALDIVPQVSVKVPSLKPDQQAQINAIFSTSSANIQEATVRINALKGVEVRFRQKILEPSKDLKVSQTCTSLYSNTVDAPSWPKSVFTALEGAGALGVSTNCKIQFNDDSDYLFKDLGGKGRDLKLRSLEVNAQALSGANPLHFYGTFGGGASVQMLGLPPYVHWKGANGALSFKMPELSLDRVRIDYTFGTVPAPMFGIGLDTLISMPKGVEVSKEGEVSPTKAQELALVKKVIAQLMPLGLQLGLELEMTDNAEVWQGVQSIVFAVLGQALEHIDQGMNPSLAIVKATEGGAKSDELLSRLYKALSVHVGYQTPHGAFALKAGVRVSGEKPAKISNFMHLLDRFDKQLTITLDRSLLDFMVTDDLFKIIAGVMPQQGDEQNAIKVQALKAEFDKGLSRLLREKILLEKDGKLVVNITSSGLNVTINGQSKRLDQWGQVFNSMG